MLVDPCIDAFRTILQRRVNADADFVAAWRATTGLTDVLPVAVTIPCDPLPRDKSAWDGVFAGNAVFPMLCVWRAEDQWAEFTWDTDETTAICQMRYIMPADAATEQTWAILSRLTKQFRIHLQQAGRATSRYREQDTRPNSPYEEDRALMIAGGVEGWAYELKARYRYDGPAGQAIYPTAAYEFTFKEHQRQDTSRLPQFTSLEARLNIKGNDQDGDAPPAINPIVTARRNR
jgi:hypothetical protein